MLEKDFHTVHDKWCRISWATAYIVALLVALVSGWCFMLAVYTTKTAGLADMHEDTERLVFGMLGMVFTVLVIMPIDPQLLIPKDKRGINIFRTQKQVDGGEAGCCNKAIDVMYSYFTFFFSIAAGCFNMYNASAMGTEKTSNASCSDARYVAPAITAMTYFICNVSVHRHSRSMAAALPTTAITVLLILHTSDVDDKDDKAPFSGAVVAATLLGCVGGFFGLFYTLARIADCSGERKRHKGGAYTVVKNGLRFLDLWNPALAAAFGWYYWIKGWQLDPPFTDWAGPFFAALGMAFLRIGVYLTAVYMWNAADGLNKESYQQVLPEDPTARQIPVPSVAPVPKKK